MIGFFFFFQKKLLKSPWQKWWLVLVISETVIDWEARLQDFVTEYHLCVSFYRRNAGTMSTTYSEEGTCPPVILVHSLSKNML